MSKRICTLIALLMLVVSMIGGTGCNRGGKVEVIADTSNDKTEPEKPQDLIIGKWQGFDEKLKVPTGFEFTKSETVQAYVRYGPDKPAFILLGKYRLLANGTLEMEWGFGTKPGEKQESQVEVTKDQLTITYKEKGTHKFKRVQEFSAELTALPKKGDAPPSSNTPEQSETLTFLGHKSAVNTVAFSPDTQLVASASDDKTVKLWNLATGKEVRTLRGHSDEVGLLAVSASGKHILSGNKKAWDGHLKVWNADSGDEILDSSLYSIVAISPDAKRLIGIDRIRTAFDSEGRFVVWDLTTGKRVCVLGNENIDALRWPVASFSPDGKQVATWASSTTRVKLWNANTGEELLTTGPDVVTRIAFHPDGKQIATAERGERVRVYELTNGQEVYSIKEFAADLAFSPDGKWLAAGINRSQGRETLSVKVWDTANQKLVISLTGHKANIKGIAFSPDRKWIAAAGQDNTVRVWDMTKVLGEPLKRPVSKETPETYRRLENDFEKKDDKKDEEKKEATILLVPDSEKVEIKKGDEKGTEVKIRVERRGLVGEVKIVADSDISEIKVDPTSGTVKAGDSEFRLTLYVGKDGIKEGRGKVTVTASAKGAKPTAAIITVIAE